MWGLRGGTLLMLMLMLMLVAARVQAQPADCPPSAVSGPLQPLAIELAGRPGVPAGVTGRTFLAVPMQPARNDCEQPWAPVRARAHPPDDVLRGPAGDVLGSPRGDLLRGTPLHGRPPPPAAGR